MLKFLLWLMYAAIIPHRYVSPVSYDPICTCAIMNGDNVNEPILEQTFTIAYTCDEEGKKDCQNLCLSMAKGALTSENGSLLVCKNIDPDVEIYVSVFSRVCHFPYETSGLSYASRLCCKNHQPVICD